MATHVLVIEDDQEINELLGEYLALEGIGYRKALTGGEGLRIAETTEPDAIILDLMLPDLDGYEVCRRLKSARRTRGIPVIMLSCMCQEDDRVKGVSSGAFRFMSKPFLPDELLETLRDAIHRREQGCGDRPAAEFEFSSPTDHAGLMGVNAMLDAVAECTTMSDAGLRQLREAFIELSQWAFRWGREHKADPRLSVRYELEQCDARKCAAIAWTIFEKQPGILSDLVFGATPGGSEFGIQYNGQASLADSPLSGWYQFIAKCQAGRFDKDPAARAVRLSRDIPADSSESDGRVSVIVVDGNRYPTRLLREAKSDPVR